MIQKKHCPKTMLKITVLDNKTKGLGLGTYFTMKNFFKLHVAPLEVASKIKLEHKESKGPRNQNTKHQEAKCQTQEKKVPSVKKIEHHTLI
jgi:hypothetical protein